MHFDIDDRGNTATQIGNLATARSCIIILLFYVGIWPTE